MKFIELTSQQYNRETNKYEPHGKFMIDMVSQWEIHDRGDSPACWVNNNIGMNKDVYETYAQIREKFVAAGMLLDLDNIVPPSATKVNGESFEALYEKFLTLLPSRTAQSYVEEGNHHPVALAFKAVLKIIADSGIQPVISVRRAELHKALMNSNFGLAHSQVKAVLDVIMPIIEGKNA